MDFISNSTSELDYQIINSPVIESLGPSSLSCFDFGVVNCRDWILLKYLLHSKVKQAQWHFLGKCASFYFSNDTTVMVVWIFTLCWRTLKLAGQDFDFFSVILSFWYRPSLSTCHYSWPSISKGTQPTTNQKYSFGEKCHIVADMYYVIRPTRV